MVSKHVDVYDACSLWACLKAVPKKFRFRARPVTLAFAVTDYKLQAQTKDELLLSIAPRPFPPHLDLKGLYAMVSRVRTRRRLRVLHRPHRSKGGFDTLYKLKHTPELAAWNAGYNAAGDWEPSLSKPTPVAKAKVTSKRKANTAAKAKAAAPKRSVTKNGSGH